MTSIPIQNLNYLLFKKLFFFLRKLKFTFVACLTNEILFLQLLLFDGSQSSFYIIYRQILLICLNIWIRLSVSVSWVRWNIIMRLYFLRSNFVLLFVKTALQITTFYTPVMRLKMLSILILLSVWSQVLLIIKRLAYYLCLDWVFVIWMIFGTESKTLELIIKFRVIMLLVACLWFFLVVIEKVFLIVNIGILLRWWFWKRLICGKAFFASVF